MGIAWSVQAYCETLRLIVVVVVWKTAHWPQLFTVLRAAFKRPVPVRFAARAVRSVSEVPREAVPVLRKKSLFGNNPWLDRGVHIR